MGYVIVDIFVHRSVHIIVDIFVHISVEAVVLHYRIECITTSPRRPTASHDPSSA